MTFLNYCLFWCWNYFRNQSIPNSWTSVHSKTKSVIFIFSVQIKCNDSNELNSGPCWLVGSMFNWALSLWYETSPKHIIPIVQKTTFFNVNNRPNDILIFVSVSVFILFVSSLFFLRILVREKGYKDASACVGTTNTLVSSYSARLTC